MAGWTARALARLTGQSPSTVAKWVSDGLITAERYGKGRGGCTIGTAGLLELTAIIELRAVGFTGRDIRRAVENLRQLSGQEHPLARLTLLVSGSDIVWRDSHELDEVRISALHQPGQRLMVFPVGERHAEWLQQLQSQGASDDDHEVVPEPSHRTRKSSEARRPVSHRYAA